MNSNEKRYTAVAIVLHWAIAAAIVSNLFVGWWMKDAIDEAATQARAIAAFQLHKSIGLTVRNTKMVLDIQKRANAHLSTMRANWVKAQSEMKN